MHTSQGQYITPIAMEVKPDAVIVATLVIPYHVEGICFMRQSLLACLSMPDKELKIFDVAVLSGVQECCGKGTEC